MKEKAMAPHSSTVAWRIPGTGEPGRLQSMELLESDTTQRLHFHFSLSCIGEGNGNPLQCSCLENPRDGGAWWAAVYGVTQSQTRLKQLSSSSRRAMNVCLGYLSFLLWLLIFSFLSSSQFPLPHMSKFALYPMYCYHFWLMVKLFSMKAESCLI